MLWSPALPVGFKRFCARVSLDTSAMAAKMSFVARAGHPCGADFHAADFLEQHPEFSWQKPLLRDMKAGPWTVFTAGQKEK